MNKVKFIIPLCAALASGCALFEAAETNPEKITVTEPATESEPLPVAQAPALKSPQRPPRALTRDEVRELQLRLKNAGFEPGPVDGVAGARTKAAVSRYQAGCAQLEPLLDDFDETGAPATNENTGRKPLDRQQVRAIQNRLRAAGFDPGPADSVFGTRTKRTLAQVKTNCPTMSEIAAAVNETVPGTGGKNLVGKTVAPKDRVIEAHSLTTPTPSTVTQTTPTAAPVRPTEEVRILQLRLRDAGFDPGPFDGVMGPKTKAALQQFEASQRPNKIKTNLKIGISGQY